jgi:small-conductance mechanosensitive channel
MLPIFITVLADISATLTRFFDFFGVDLETARRQGVRLLAIWLLAGFCWYMVGKVAERIVKAADDGDDKTLSYREKRAQTVSGLLKGVGRILIVLFGIVLTLDTFMEIGPLLAGAGILGLAVSFGAQSLVKDVIAGFFILMEHQFDVGDVIEVAGKSGSVERMTLRVVMLRDLEGTLHVVPNGQITTTSNRTRGWSRAVLDIGVGYASDVDVALETLRQEARAFADDSAWSYKLDGPPEVVGVQGLGDNAVTIRVMLRTRPGMQWEVGREFRRRAKIRLDREGIEIPFPQRTVHVRHYGAGAGSDDDAAAAAAGGA